MSQSKEFERFDKTMGALLRVSHSELKAKLDAEKARKGKRTRNVRRDAKPGA
jgi:hypothetical protein